MYWCEKKEKFMPANSEEAENCRGYWGRATYADREAGAKAIKESEDFQKENSGYTSVGCYISTAVVSILKMKDDCPMLQTLRFLRGFYMQSDTHYKTILMTYDVVGPMIAKALWEDENREHVASDILLCLQNATKLVAHGNMEGAIAIYVDMTQNLIDLYSPSFVIGAEAAKNYDQQSGGHGAFVMTKRS